MSANTLTLAVPVQHGKLAPSQAQQFAIDRCLEGFEGKAVELKLDRVRDTRSLRQNKFLWGVVLATIAEATGNTTEDLHEYFKTKFLPRRFVVLNGKEQEVTKTTTTLTTDEFSKYLEQLAAFAATELGITIPDRP